MCIMYHDGQFYCLYDYQTLVINTIGFICINKQMYNIHVILEYSKKNSNIAISS